MEKGLFEKTGKSLDHWIAVVKKSGHEKHKAIMDYLKSDHGFTHGFANFVALSANKSAAVHADDDDLIANQYKGKETLIPIYEALDKILNALGDDISITPKKDSISYIRKNQFALIKPATKTRIDLGLKIKGQEPEGILESSGPFGAMCTHRIQITEIGQLTKELKEWIQLAYDKSV